MKLKLNKSGGVDFIRVNGKDRVRSTMLSSEAQDIVRNGEVITKGNEIIVNGKFIFEIEGAETQIEESVIEDKPLKEAVKEDKPVKKPRRKAKKCN